MLIGSLGCALTALALMTAPPASIEKPVGALALFPLPISAAAEYIIEPPDVLKIELPANLDDLAPVPVGGKYLVRPDGTIGLGRGSAFVAGLTLEQARHSIAHAIATAQLPGKRHYEKVNQVLEGLKVEVAEHKSKFYYVIIDGDSLGEQVIRVACTGNETVLDAIAQVEGLPRVASKKKIWIARATPTEAHAPHVLPVDWVAITQLGAAATNYQIQPGDRIHVSGPTETKEQNCDWQRLKQLKGSGNVR